MNTDVTLHITYDPAECLDPHLWDWEAVLSVQMSGQHPQITDVLVVEEAPVA